MIYFQLFIFCKQIENFEMTNNILNNIMVPSTSSGASNLINQVMSYGKGRKFSTKS